MDGGSETRPRPCGFPMTGSGLPQNLFLGAKLNSTLHTIACPKAYPTSCTLLASRSSLLCEAVQYSSSSLGTCFVPQRCQHSRVQAQVRHPFHTTGKSLSPVKPASRQPVIGRFGEQCPLFTNPEHGPDRAPLRLPLTCPLDAIPNPPMPNLQKAMVDRSYSTVSTSTTSKAH